MRKILSGISILASSLILLACSTSVNLKSVKVKETDFFISEKTTIENGKKDENSNLYIIIDKVGENVVSELMPVNTYFTKKYGSNDQFGESVSFMGDGKDGIWKISYAHKVRLFKKINYELGSLSLPESSYFEQYFKIYAFEAKEGMCQKILLNSEKEKKRLAAEYDVYLVYCNKAKKVD